MLSICRAKTERGTDMYINKSSDEILIDIKKQVTQSYNYFRKNYMRYHEFMKFVFETTLTQAERSALSQIDRPGVEFNVIEAYFSRILGEFMAMEPGFSITAADGVKNIDPELIKVIEAHFKACFSNTANEELSYRVFREMLGGGFSVVKMYTDYANRKSFDQKIFIERSFDPTLCGFDPMARESHKGDGRFCFENFPKSKDDAIAQFGSDVVKGVSFIRDSTNQNNFQNFNWSYLNESEPIMMFCEYYCKKSKEETILKLSNGHVVTKKQYENFITEWDRAGIIMQPPIPVKQRKTQVEKIVKYTVCETGIVEKQDTDFEYFPLVFFDGNSVNIRETDQSAAKQVTRSYAWQARDAQRLKNFAGQSLCNEMETLVQHKWIAPIEGIPDNEDYQQAYIKPQLATVLLYNQFKGDDPNVQINPPREVVRPPIPPELANTFMMADQLIQNILGSYDAALGINNNNLSGRAIQMGAIQSNAAAKPYQHGFMAGWNRCAQIYLDLLPKYYVTPRSIPVIDEKGKHSYYIINDGQGVSFNYDATALDVKVESGVNFEIQKQIALETLLELMARSETFNQFMNTKGLGVLLDNIDIRGIDQLKGQIEEYMEEIQQQQQAAAEKEQNTPTMEEILAKEVEVEAMSVEQKREAAEKDNETKVLDIMTTNAQKTKDSDIKFLEVMSKIQNADLKVALDQEKTDAENVRSAIELTMKAAEANERKEEPKPTED